MKIKTRSRIVVFLLSFLVWVALNSIRDLQEVIAGIVVALIVTLIAGEFLITSERKGGFIRRFFSAIIYFSFRNL